MAHSLKALYCLGFGNLKIAEIGIHNAYHLRDEKRISLLASEKKLIFRLSLR